jgi:hypothetical protein
MVSSKEDKMNTIKLDCGHKPSEHGNHTTGYGTLDGKTYMIEDGHRVLYITQNGNDCPQEVTNWPGTLRFPIKHWKGSRGVGFGRWYQVTHVWFNGPDGYEWIGRNAGDMDLTRCKRTKTRA